MEKSPENKANKRREFIRSTARLTLALGIGGVSGLALSKSTEEEWVWQIDPFECICAEVILSQVLSISIPGLKTNFVRQLQ
jgi:hypothetical protein